MKPVKIKMGAIPNNRPKSPFRKEKDPNSEPKQYVPRAKRVVPDHLFNVDSQTNWLF